MSDRSPRSGARHQSREKPGFAARRAAVQILRAVLEERHQLSDLVGSSGPMAGLSGPDRARAQRLATTTLRHLDRADLVLSQFMEHTPPHAALAILRVAVVELCQEGEAAHGVVDTAVNLMRRSRKASKLSGLANAVLRKVAEHGPEIWPDLDPQPLPKWLRRRVIHIYNEDIVRAMEAAHLAGAPIDLSLRDKTATDDWAKTLDAEILPTGSLRLRNSAQVTELPGFEDGAWWVQDAAAALAVNLLNPQPGEAILDLCAAPGGKTLQLAAAGADVVALDVSIDRMSRVEENLRRTGLDATTITADALNWTPDQQFDAILLDAPCSATGTIRRHPDLPHVKHGKELDALFELQAQLMDRAADMLKPGGRLVYCTCSLLTEEGERQAKLAKERLGLIDIAPDVDSLGIDPAWVSPQGGLRLRPDYWADKGGMDGFYMIALGKPQ